MEIHLPNVTLSDGSALTIDDPRFGATLPITKKLIDNFGRTNDLQELIAALVTAVVALEARGTSLEGLAG